MTNHAEEIAMEVRHFLITPDGHVHQYSHEEAQHIARGENALPEFAGSWVRYLQVQMDESKDGEGIQVMTAAARVQFDEQGKLQQTAAPDPKDPALTEFEHETCVQLALAPVVNLMTTAH